MPGGTGQLQFIDAFRRQDRNAPDAARPGEIPEVVQNGRHFQSVAARPQTEPVFRPQQEEKARARDQDALALLAEAEFIRPEQMQVFAGQEVPRRFRTGEAGVLPVIAASAPQIRRQRMPGLLENILPPARRKPTSLPPNEGTISYSSTPLPIRRAGRSRQTNGSTLTSFHAGSGGNGPGGSSRTISARLRQRTRCS